MARLIKRLRNQPANAVLDELVYEWLPRVYTEQGPILSAFFTQVDIQAGSDKESLIKSAFTAHLGPWVTLEYWPFEEPDRATFGQVLAAKKRQIFLNRALVTAVTQVNDEPSRNFLCGKLLHELVHWVELKKTGSFRAGGIEHGWEMECAFHELTPEKREPRTVPSSLRAAFLANRRGTSVSSSVLADNAIDGRESIGNTADTEAVVRINEELAEERQRGEPLLTLESEIRSPSKEENRHDSPDYFHLAPVAYSERLFTLDAQLLDLYCRLNDIELAENTRTLIGIRGARLFGTDSGENFLPFDTGPGIGEMRADHESPRCVIGVWNRDDGKIALFPGSTVPNRKHMRVQAAKCRDGQPTEMKANQLPTGHYQYACGTHGENVWGALRLDRKVVVMRNCNDEAYRFGDVWHACYPFDNIHPSFDGTGTRFSSAGCQTVVGSFTDDNRHVSPWAAFRQSAELTNSRRCANNRSPFSYILVTARELRVMRYLLDTGDATAAHPDPNRLMDPYRRLRFGASGERVKKLQRALRINDDGDFGPLTMEALIEAQKNHPIAADGICSPKVARALGVAIWDRQASEETIEMPDLPVAVSEPDLGVQLPVFQGVRLAEQKPTVIKVQQLLNRLGYLRRIDGDYGPSTAQAVSWAKRKYGFADTDGRKVDHELVTRLANEPPLHPDLTTEGVTFIGLCEIGSPPLYEKMFTYPHFPGESSGITIGVGYDLRFVSEAKFKEDWQDFLDQAIITALALFCQQAGNKETAARLKRDNIKIPFTDASRVFSSKTIPKTIVETAKIYPQLNTLNGLCQAALVSLVYNRGNSVDPNEDRRKEMRRIATALEDGTLGQIPDLILDMKRLWPRSEGLRKRRDQEAALFGRGLASEIGY